jgi:carbonic anhydrase
MPATYSQILEKNRAWVDRRNREDPTYFENLAVEHKPRFLFIGCSDARVPADLITQTSAGEMFVHRNVANMIVPTDNNLLAVLQYAVDALHVSDIIVCGHYGCGGVKAAMAEGGAPPLVENWLSNIRTVARMHEDELSDILDEHARYQRLVELNVVEQVYNLTRTQVVKSAWAAGKTLRVHGCVYELTKGLLYDLSVTAAGPTDLSAHSIPALAVASQS